MHAYAARKLNGTTTPLAAACSRLYYSTCKLHACSRLHWAQVAKDARLARLAKLAPGPASAADKRA